MSGAICGGVLSMVVNDCGSYTGMDVEYSYNDGLIDGYNTAVVMVRNNDTPDQIVKTPLEVRTNAEKYGLV